TDSVKPCVRRAVRREGLGAGMDAALVGSEWNAGAVGRRGDRASRSDGRRRNVTAGRSREKGGGVSRAAGRRGLTRTPPAVSPLARGTREGTGIGSGRQGVRSALSEDIHPNPPAPDAV